MPPTISAILASGLPFWLILYICERLLKISPRLSSWLFGWKSLFVWLHFYQVCLYVTSSCFDLNPKITEVSMNSSICTTTIWDNGFFWWVFKNGWVHIAPTEKPKLPRWSPNDVGDVTSVLVSVDWCVSPLMKLGHKIWISLIMNYLFIFWQIWFYIVYIICYNSSLDKSIKDSRNYLETI